MAKQTNLEISLFRKCRSLNNTAFALFHLETISCTSVFQFRFSSSFEAFL